MAEHNAIILVGSRYHEPWFGGELLMKLLAEEGLAAIRTDQGSILTEERLAQTHLVAFYCEGRWDQQEPASRRLTPAQEAALVNYVEAGGGFLGVHGATVFTEDYERYRQMIGGHFNGHGPMREFTISVETPDHPVTEGIGEYSVFDEPYEVEQYADSQLLLSSQWDGRTWPLGWAKPCGEGRVCYLANGHDARSLDKPEVQQLVRRAARWCARV